MKTKLEKLIKESGKSPHKIAKEAKVDHSTVYRLLSGEMKTMYLDSAFRLADALGVDINEFRGDNL